MTKGNFIIQIIVILSLVMLQYSCSSDKLPASYADVGICFETEILPISISNCTQSSCHNPVDRADGYDFTTYDGIMEAVKPFNANGSEFYESITETNLNDIMPPPPNTPLNTTQISLIKDWIDKGAPNTFDCFAGANCDTLTNVSFSAAVLPVLDTYCNGCHSGNTPQGGIDQSNWAAVNATVNDGSFMGSINHDNGFVAMPLNGAKIPACDILLIQTWVDEGALNN